MDKEISFTTEQIIFMRLKARLSDLQEILDKNPNDTEAKEKKDKIIETLFNIVKNYAYKEMHRIRNGSSSSPSELADMKQDIFLSFLANLDKYDPLRSAPITFFSKHFKQVISKNVLYNNSGLTPYDAGNYRKITQVKNYYNQMGIEPTVDLLVAKSGLSANVIERTIMIKEKQIREDVQQANYMPAKALTPESQATQNEFTETLGRVLLTELTPDELEILLLKLNFDGKKELNYEQFSEKLSEKYGRTINHREAKQWYNAIICKLNQSEQLAQVYTKKECTTMSIKLQVDTKFDESSFIFE